MKNVIHFACSLNMAILSTNQADNQSIQLTNVGIENCNNSVTIKYTVSARYNRGFDFSNKTIKTSKPYYRINERW